MNKKTGLGRGLDALFSVDSFEESLKLNLTKINQEELLIVKALMNYQNQ